MLPREVNEIVVRIRPPEGSPGGDHWSVAVEVKAFTHVATLGGEYEGIKLPMETTEERAWRCDYQEAHGNRMEVVARVALALSQVFYDLAPTPYERARLEATGRLP